MWGRRWGKLEPWETAYLAEERCRDLHGFDDEQLRPYFSLDGTLAGLFTLAEKLYGITITELPTSVEGTEKQESKNGGAKGGRAKVPVWDASVRYFEVRDGNGDEIGAFYMDLFPRTGKRSGAWLSNGLGEGHRNEHGQWVLPLGVIAANLTPSTETQPSLLAHREVETLFHEFGHLLHHLFGKVDYASLNGTNVVWDFVELPSQIMENWTWEREGLDLFARHYRTGEPLPEELFQKLRKTRNYLIAITFMRQLSLQKMDLDLHIGYENQGLDRFIDRSTADYRIPYRTHPLSIVRHFGHLFSDSVGYAAGYYSYKWAEVLEADAFERFLTEGIFNRETADSFRRRILERGNGAPAGDLYRDFRGRDPRPDALLRRSELAPAVQRGDR
jgi:oligopeptidase A